MPKESLIVRGLKVGGMELAEVWYPPGSRTPRLKLDEIEIMLVASGELSVGKGGAQLASGSAILRRLDVNVPLHATRNVRVVSVRTPFSFRGADPQRFSNLESWTVLPEAAADDVRRLHSALLVDRSEDSVLLEGLGLVVASWAERQLRPATTIDARPGWMRMVFERLADLSRTPALRELASEAEVSVAHLSRVFRQFEDCTVGEYQRRLRVAAACRLMQRAMPLSQVAIVTGFADQAHFSRTFRKQMGMTPRDYRKSLASRPGRGEFSAPRLGFDPVGIYPFRSRTANGTPYEGVLEITGSEDGYGGIVRTTVMPDVIAETVAIHGRRVVMTASVPAGLAILQLSFDRDRFTGEWRLAGKATSVNGYRSRRDSSSETPETLRS